MKRLFAGSFFCLCLIGVNVSAEDKILTCDGTWSQEGMNLPPHAKNFIQADMTVKNLQYIVNGKSIQEVSDSPNIKIDPIEICSTSDAAYVYSWNCSVQLPRLMAVDFTKEDYPWAEDSVYRKKYHYKPHSTDVGQFEIIYLNRVNLSVLVDHYNFHESTDDDKAGKSTSIPKNYVIIEHMNLQCRIAKPKL